MRKYFNMDVLIDTVFFTFLAFAFCYFTYGVFVSKGPIKECKSVKECK